MIRQWVTGLGMLSIVVVAPLSVAQGQLGWRDAGPIGGVPNTEWYYACTGDKVSDHTQWHVRFKNSRPGPTAFSFVLASSPSVRGAEYGLCLAPGRDIDWGTTASKPDDVPCTGNPYIRPFLIVSNVEAGDSTQECNDPD